MTEGQIGWVAGIIEGEGTIAVPPGNIYPSIRVEMADKDIIDRLQSITGLGKVVMRKTKQQPHHKTKWVWSVCARAEVISLIEEITPWRGERRLDRINQAVVRLARPIGVSGPKPRVPCGTRTGAQRHYSHGEKPCESCRIALNEDQNKKNARKKGVL